jgi:hypothetical protein
MRTLRPTRVAILFVAAFALIDCRSGHEDGWSSRARAMVLTSGPSEIVLSSSKVPGYWANEAGSGQEFFLYTRDRSYEKGNRVTVEGPFGNAYPAVFREEAGTYLRGDPAFVLVVWKMKMEKEAEDHASHS